MPNSQPKLVTYGLSRAAKMAFKRMESTELEDLLEVTDKSDKDMQVRARLTLYSHDLVGLFWTTALPMKFYPYFTSYNIE